MNVTLDEIIKAAEKNGYPWNGHGAEPSDKQTYCILQQIGMNLFDNNAWIPLADALDALDYDARIGREVWHYNDDKATSYQNAVEYLKGMLVRFPKNTVVVVFQRNK